MPSSQGKNNEDDFFTPKTSQVHNRLGEFETS